MKIFSQTERAPRAVLIEADAEPGGDEHLGVELQLIAGLAVDDVHAELLAPIRAPVRLEVAFHHENKLLDVLRDGLEPRVVFRRVILFVRREQLDDRAERALRRKHGAIVRAVLFDKARRVIAVDQFFNEVEIFFQIRDEDRAGENRVGDGLGDFRFAAAGNGAGLVANETFRRRADEPPCAVRPRWLFHLHLVAGRADVSFFRLQLDRMRARVVRPRDGLLVQVEFGVLRHIHDGGIFFVHAVAFRLHVHETRVEFRRLGKTVFQLPDVLIAAELFAEIVARKHQRAAGVLLLGVAEQVCGVADLRLHFLFAIAVIVVGDDRDDDTVFVAARQLERVATVVDFVLGLPAHPVAALAFCGLVPMRQADRFFRGLDQVRREDDAAGVAAPMFRIQRRIVLRQQRITRVSKNAFDEIQVAHQISGNEETDFHRLFRCEPGHGGADQRTQQHRHKTICRLGLRGGEWQLHDLARRGQREFQHLGEGDFWHAQLVVRNRQAALGHVKDSRRRAPVAARVV